MNNAFTQWCWRMYCEYKHALEECDILYEHPTRKSSWVELRYHIWGFWNELTHPWYCFKRGVRNLVRWFPTIWRTDVFDHTYLFDVMDKQLEDMEKFFYSENTHCCGAKQRAKRIRWTRKLLKMHRDEHYTMLNFYEDEKRNGPMLHESKVVQEDEFGIPTLYSWDSGRTEEQNTKYFADLNVARKMDEKVWKLFIKNFSRCNEWWD